MFGVISDIHANYDALRAVFAELDALGVESVICLGDIVGYGPEPARCIDLVRERCEVTLCGNHDFALVYGAQSFHSAARSSVEHHRRLLMPRPGQDDEGERRERWEFLKSLPKRHVRGDMLFVHGAPRNPINEYLRKVDVLLGVRKKFGENFNLVDWLCFVGHTHRGGVVTQELKWIEPEQIHCRFEAQPHQKAIINVGSVGQPRDRDARASFVTVCDEGEVRWHRVEYDIDSVARKVAESPGLDPSLADRLRNGQ